MGFWPANLSQHQRNLLKLSQGLLRISRRCTVSVFLNLNWDLILNKKYCKLNTPCIFSISILNYYYIVNKLLISNLGYRCYNLNLGWRMKLNTVFYGKQFPSTVVWRWIHGDIKNLSAVLIYKLRLYHRMKEEKTIFKPLAGIEPHIFGLLVRRVNHYTTRTNHAGNAAS